MSYRMLPCLEVLSRSENEGSCCLQFYKGKQLHVKVRVLSFHRLASFMGLNSGGKRSLGFHPPISEKETKYGRAFFSTATILTEKPFLFHPRTHHCNLTTLCVPKLRPQTCRKVCIFKSPSKVGDCSRLATSDKVVVESQANHARNANSCKVKSPPW